MPTSQTKELKVFYCYAREDQHLREQLEQHLSNLKRLYHLKTWFDREILPGEDWEAVIEENLNTADLVFLLISPSFMASDYCYNKEMQRALERHTKGEVKVIPIHLRPVHWKNAPFSMIQMLPKDALPVTRWPNSDDAFYDVALGIEQVIEQLLLSRKTKEEWVVEGNTLFDLNQYEKALKAYEQAIRLDPNDIIVHISRGDILHNLKHYKDAIHAYAQAVRLKSNFAMKTHHNSDALKELHEAEQAVFLYPNDAFVYINKSHALLKLERYEEALQACEQAIRLDPDPIAYNNKSYALNSLKRYEEALQACEQAIQLEPLSIHKSAFAPFYKNKGNILNSLKRYEEALQVCKQAIHLDPLLTPIYAIMGITLFKLKRYEESSESFAKWSELYFS